jgi:hypothetical protein
MFITTKENKVKPNWRSRGVHLFYFALFFSALASAVCRCVWFKRSKKAQALFLEIFHWFVGFFSLRSKKLTQRKIGGGGQNPPYFALPSSQRYGISSALESSAVCSFAAA